MHDAIKSALRMAVEKVLVDLRETNTALGSEPHLAWRRVSGGWQGEDETRPSDTRPVDRTVNWEAEASAFDRALRERGCLAFRGLLTGMTGYHAGSPSSLLRSLVLEVLQRTGSAIFNPDIVDRLIQEVSDFVDSPVIVIPFLAPLLNFTTDRTEAISFDDGIVLRPLTDGEMTRLHGGMVTGGFRGSEFPLHGFTFAGEAREAKEPGTTRSDGNVAVRRELIARLKRLVLGLRTFKAGPVGFDALHCNSTGVLSWLGGALRYGFGNEYIPFGTYRITDAEVEALQQHVRLLCTRLHSSLEAACGRLATAQVRIEPRDMLIDAVVGLEAILLSHTGDPTYRGEMGYRFAMNYAVLHESPADRYKRFFVARSFYALRSTLVHGQQVEDYKIGNETLTLRTAAETACEMLRVVVAKFLPGGKHPDYLADHYWPKRCFLHGDGTDALRDAS